MFVIPSQAGGTSRRAARMDLTLPVVSFQPRSLVMSPSINDRN